MLCAVLACGARADDVTDPPPACGERGAFPIPQADDRRFVVDVVDMPCTFHSTVAFNIPVTRYVGPTDGAGHLRDASQLVDRFLLSRYATLELPAYDVDYNCESYWQPPCERDRVFFNGEQVNLLNADNSEYLHGLNDTWIMNRFQIPIERVRFPAAPGENGNPPQPAMNELRIDIDVLCPTGDCWCTALDWISLEIKCMSPVILIHGNGSNGEFFGRQLFTLGLQDECLFAYDYSINLPGTDPNHAGCAPRAVNARQLDGLLPLIVRSFGTDSVHLVAHSKGGLDAREYLARFQPQHDGEFKVLSLITVSTPHDGSVGADVLEKRAIAARIAAKVEFSGFPFMADALAGIIGTDPGNRDLQTAVCAQFNRVNVPALGRDAGSTAYGTIAAEADRDGSENINQDIEYWEMTWENAKLQAIYQNAGSWAASAIVDRMYQTLRTTTAVRVSFRPWEDDLSKIVTTLTGVTGGPFLNDCMVTVDSGLGDGAFASLVPRERKQIFSGNASQYTWGRNHASVANDFSARYLAE
jgi:pimeloyl-ACP methyl ester carboxylesterase